MINYLKLIQQTRKSLVIFSCIFLIACLLNCSGKFTPKSFYSYEQEARPINSEQSEKLKREIQKYYKAPYQWGGNSTHGTDCSGLISMIYLNALGVVIPHNAAQLYYNCVPIKSNQLQLGDLVFFGNVFGKPTHVGLYVDNGYFLDATRKRGVALSRLKDSYYRRQYIGSGRIRIN